MKRIGVMTRDRRLYQKIRLALLGEYECRLLSYDESGFGLDTILVDRRGEADEAALAKLGGELFSASEPHYNSGAEKTKNTDVAAQEISIVRRKAKTGGELSYPFGFDELREIITEHRASTSARLLVTEGERRAILDGAEIQLTELEHRLLWQIYNARGRYVSREALGAAVWGKEASNSLISVYIHYLREKLETGGERIIISSRGGGYKIQEKYLGGEGEC